MNVFRRAAAAAAAMGLVGVGVLVAPAPAGAAPVTKFVTCTSAAKMDIVPNGSGGADYTITDGAGWCVQGIPFEGAWTVTYSGSGSATSLSCTPILGGTVSGLTLNMTLRFVNVRTGNASVVNETWTSLLPISTFNVVPVNVSGGTQGLLETHIFNQCPPAGTPSAYIEWNDKNAPRT